MPIENKQTNVIWRMSDGRAGHDSQSKGLVKALNLIKPCACYDLDISDKKYEISDLLFKKFPAAEQFPDPDIILSAGHRTHFFLLCAKRARGGKTIVIMKPSLPSTWFDFCFIPEHDNPTIADNVLTTKGALNNITPSPEKMNDRGLMLIGGPSKHFLWDNEYLIQQLRKVLARHSDVKWEISDSIRTPEITRNTLAKLRSVNAEYKNYSTTGKDWVARQLSLAANVWVSTDSVSMIYESLSSGTAVGLFDVPTRNTSKLSENIAGLVENKMVTPYSQWLLERKLNTPPVLLNEAKRCAEHIYAIGLLH